MKSVRSDWSVCFAFVKRPLRRHIERVRKFAFPYSLLLLAFWTGWLLAGDYVVVETSARQVLAGRFATTRAEIMRSDLGQGMLRRHGVDIAYSYTVNGVNYTGRRYRYDDGNDAFDYRAVTEAFPPGSRQRVYYNAANPSDSVLEPGVDGCDLLFALFAIPLNVVTAAVWIAAVRSRRGYSHKAPAGGVRILQGAGETRVRLAEFSPVAAGFFALAAAAFAAAMLVVLVAGFAPSLRLMSAALMATAGAAVAAFVWMARRNHSGRYDLRIREGAQTLVLPPGAGRDEPLIVPRGEIVGVSMRRRVSNSPSGQHFSYVPALDRAAPNAEAQSLLLVKWGWTEGKARAFAQWISQQLGVPFKGMDFDQG